jgi:hypothetical protein
VAGVVVAAERYAAIILSWQALWLPLSDMWSSRELLVAPCAGMNLHSGLEETQSTGPFLAVAAGCIIGTAVTYSLVRDWTVLSSPAGRHTARVRKFVARIGLTAPAPNVGPLSFLLNNSVSATRPLVVAASGTAGNETQLRLTRKQFAT